MGRVAHKSIYVHCSIYVTLAVQHSVGKQHRGSDALAGDIQRLGRAAKVSRGDHVLCNHHRYLPLLNWRHDSSAAVVIFTGDSTRVTISTFRIPGLRLPIIRFDGRLVADLLAPQENSTVPKLDSAIRGGVKMTRRRDRQGSLRIKDGSWYVQWTEGNHRPSHCLGREKELTKSEAQKLRREWMKKLNDHREVAGNSRTLASFWREHFYDEEKKEINHELKDKKPSTARDMKWVMKQIWLPRFGARMLDGLGTAEIQKYLDSLNLNRNTAAKYRTYLSSVFSSAIRLGHGLTYNPARFVKLPAEGPEKPYVMPTAEQVVAIQNGLKAPIHKMAWQLAVWLGTRSGELRGLRWESIVWEHDTVYIRESVWEGNSTSPKTKKEQY